MLLRAGDLPRDERWAVEVKFDGCRVQVRAHTGAITLRTRPGRLCTDQFPELAGLADAIPEAILDAELVCLDATGRPDFSRLRGRLVAHTVAAVERAAAGAPATLMIFDVLWHEGDDVWRRCYDDRRAVLERLALEGASWRTPRRFCAVRDDLAAVTREHQLEGVVAKRRDAPYEPGRRSGAWIKFKHWRRERLQAIAWLPAHGASGRDGLLLARADEHGQRTLAGVVQLGLADDRRLALQQLASVAHADRRLPLCGVLVDVDHNGPRGGPLRDAVLREVRATA